MTEQANAGTYGFGITAVSATVVYSTFDFGSPTAYGSVPQVFSVKFTEDAANVGLEA